MDRGKVAVAGGLALVAANVYKDTARANGWASALDHWQPIAIEAGVVLGAGYFALRDQRVATVLLVLVAVLWAVFLLRGGFSATSSASTATGRVTHRGTAAPASTETAPPNIRRVV